jgi:16S rRNA (guanine(966)-N(2))-methyltransferase RsmD
VADRQLQASRKVAQTSAGEVRLLGGRWKRTPLPVPVAAGLRPTPARVRETLFNWLGQDLSGWRVLDAFAGSGALGLEAASRGAQAVCLLERNPTLSRALSGVVAHLKAQEQVVVLTTDARAWMRQPAQQGRFDLVLLDPPFDEADFFAVLNDALTCVPEGGWLYLECPQALSAWPAVDAPAALREHLALHRHGRAGAVHFHLFQRVGAPKGAASAGEAP